MIIVYILFFGITTLVICYLLLPTQPSPLSSLELLIQILSLVWQNRLIYPLDPEQLVHSQQLIDFLFRQLYLLHLNKYSLKHDVQYRLRLIYSNYKKTNNTKFLIHELENLLSVLEWKDLWELFHVKVMSLSPKLTIDLQVSLVELCYRVSQFAQQVKLVNRKMNIENRVEMKMKRELVKKKWEICKENIEYVSKFYSLIEECASMIIFLHFQFAFLKCVGIVAKESKQVLEIQEELDSLCILLNEQISDGNSVGLLVKRAEKLNYQLLEILKKYNMLGHFMKHGFSPLKSIDPDSGNIELNEWFSEADVRKSVKETLKNSFPPQNDEKIEELLRQKQFIENAATNELSKVE